MRSRTGGAGLHPTVVLWLIVGWTGYAVLPWYGLEDNFFGLSWVAGGYPIDPEVAPALFLVVVLGSSVTVCVFHTCLPVAASSATTLPRKRQHS